MHSGITPYSLKKIARKYHKPAGTNVTTSYSSGDDGNLRSTDNELTDFYTLKIKNVFGNFLRFTDINGKAVVAGTTSYIIDHFTGFGFTLGQAANNWATHLANSQTFTLTVSGQTLSGFYLPNLKELDTIRSYATSYGLDIVSETTDQWTSTTDSTTTANAMVLTSASRYVSVVKTSTTRKAIYFRKHFI